MNIKKLIKKSQNGDQESFNELIKFYYPFVLKFLSKLVSNKDITSDLVQEVFIKLIKNIEKFDINGKASFNTYLIAIAKNTYIDYIRKNNKELQELDIETLPSKINIDIDYLKKEEYTYVLEKIDNLPLLQKEVIKLKYLEGYTLEEIAKIQKVESKTIKSRLFEARKKLREELKGSDIYE